MRGRVISTKRTSGPGCRRDLRGAARDCRAALTLVTATSAAKLTVAPAKAADVVTANLTGTLLVREAASLAAAVVDGSLIVSGLLAAERGDVVAAFEPRRNRVVWEAKEDGWVGLILSLDQSEAN